MRPKQLPEADGPGIEDDPNSQLNGPENQLPGFSGETLYRQLAENSPDIIFIFDRTAGRIIYLNRKTLFGFAPDELGHPGKSSPGSIPMTWLS